MLLQAKGLKNENEKGRNIFILSAIKVTVQAKVIRKY